MILNAILNDRWKELLLEAFEENYFVHSFITYNCIGHKWLHCFSLLKESSSVFNLTFINCCVEFDHLISRIKHLIMKSFEYEYNIQYDSSYLDFTNKCSITNVVTVYRTIQSISRLTFVYIDWWLDDYSCMAEFVNVILLMLQRMYNKYFPRNLIIMSLT